MARRRSERTPAAVKPLLRHSLWEFFQQLRRSVQSFDQHYFPLFYTKLSVAIDPDEVERSDRETVLNESVDLLLVTRPPNSIAVAAFDDLGSQRPREERAAKAKLLQRLGISYFQIEGRQSAAQVSAWATALNKLSAPAPTERLRKIINQNQFDAITTATAITDEYELVCLHEIALDAFLQVSLRDLRKQYPELFSSADFNPNFFKQTSVDALIATPPPFSTPLFVIEFDGATHRQDENQIRKDRRKDTALQSAGLPGIRIHSELLRRGAARFSHKATQLQQQFLSFITDHLSDQQHDDFWHIEQLNRFIIQELDTLPPAAAQAAEAIHCYALKIHSLVSRKENDRSQLIEQLAKTKAESQKWQEYAFPEDPFVDADIALKEAEEMRSNPNAFLIPAGIDCSFELRSSGENPRMYNMVATLTPDQFLVRSGWYPKPIKFPSPSVGILPIGDDPTRLDNLATDFLKSFLVHSVIAPRYSNEEKVEIADALIEGVMNFRSAFHSTFRKP